MTFRIPNFVVPSTEQYLFTVVSYNASAGMSPQYRIWKIDSATNITDTHNAP
jgi:hypothetical protein